MAKADTLLAKVLQSDRSLGRNATRGLSVSLELFQAFLAILHVAFCFLHFVSLNIKLFSV